MMMALGHRILLNNRQLAIVVKSTGSKVIYCLLQFMNLKLNAFGPPDLQTLRPSDSQTLRPSDSQTCYLTPNLKVVLERNGSSGVRITDGNDAWLGLSG